MLSEPTINVPPWIAQEWRDIFGDTPENWETASKESIQWLLQRLKSAGVI